MNDGGGMKKYLINLGKDYSGFWLNRSHTCNILYPKTKALQPVIWLIHHVVTAAQSGSGVFMKAEQS